MIALTRLLVGTTCLAVALTLTLIPIAAQPPAAGTMNREREDVSAAETPKSNEISLLMRIVQSPEPENVIRSDADKALADKVLKYYLYRLTWEEVQHERDPAKVGTVANIMQDVVGNVENNPRLFPRNFSGPPADQDMAQTRIRQLANVQQLAPIYIKYCKILLQNRMPIARINAARILAKLAEWGQESVVDELTAIITNPAENDAVRHWAFRGLEDIFNLQGSNDIRAKGLFQDKNGVARFNKALAATLAWLDSRTKVPDAKVQNMKAEEQAGLRYVRRSAERALGAARRPLIVDDRGAGKQEGPVADLLGKIVSADASVVPAPDLRERLDAALALCQLRADSSPSYQPDFAAHQIGMFLTVMGAQANSDKDNKDTPAVNYKFEANRLKMAIDGFSRQKTSGAVTGYLANLAVKVDGLLKFFDDFAVNPGAVKDLNDWLRDNQPASKSVYKAAGEK